MSIQKGATDLDPRKIEKQYRNLYYSAPTAFFTINAADGRILNCNQAALKLLNYSRKEMLQMKVFELYADTPHGLPKAQKIFKDFQAGKSVRNIELQIKRGTGDLVWVSLSVEPEMDSDGKPIKSLSVMVDMSDRRQAGIALHKSYKSLLKLVEKRTVELAEANLQLKQEIKERKRTEREITAQKQKEAELVKEQSKLEQRVKIRTEQLVETNNALSVLARNIDQRWEEAQKESDRVIDSKILPIIENLQKNKVLINYWTEFDMLKAHLNEISSHSTGEPCSIFMLTNAELRVASMIKKGLKSPEIARKLFISRNTVKTHRRNIRKKLNIHNSKINLASYLRAKMR